MITLSGIQDTVRAYIADDVYFATRGVSVIKDDGFQKQEMLNQLSSTNAKGAVVIVNPIMDRSVQTAHGYPKTCEATVQVEVWVCPERNTGDGGANVDIEDAYCAVIRAVSAYNDTDPSGDIQFNFQKSGQPDRTLYNGGWIAVPVVFTKRATLTID